jgi:ankyrin repeat protein
MAVVNLESPMDWAIASGRKEVVRCLVDSARKASATGVKSGYALFRAIQCRSVDMVEFLVNNNLVAIDDKDGKGRTALHLAASMCWKDVAMFDFLIQKGHANVEARDSEGFTTLHCASRSGSIHCVQVLLNDGGADVEARDSHGRTALHHSAEFGHHVVSKYLVSLGKANEELVDDDGQTALHFACSHADTKMGGYYFTVKCLVESGRELARH